VPPYISPAKLVTSQVIQESAKEGTAGVSSFQQLVKMKNDIEYEGRYSVFRPSIRHHLL
jgi:hypothetical protein